MLAVLQMSKRLALCKNVAFCLSTIMCRSASLYAVCSIVMISVHVVGEACDGKQAIELVPLYQPHVVLMDFYMPRMNGVEAARIMKEFWQEIAIIGISSAPDTHITDAFLKAGAAAVVSKDQGDHLYSTINKIFRSQSAQFC